MSVEKGARVKISESTKKVRGCVPFVCASDCNVAAPKKQKPEAQAKLSGYGYFACASGFKIAVRPNVSRFWLLFTNRKALGEGIKESLHSAAASATEDLLHGVS